MHILQERAGKANGGSPSEVANIVRDLVGGTPLYNGRAQVEGDNQTVRRRKEARVLEATEGSSHR